MNRKKVKNVYRVRDIQIKKGLAKSKIKKVNLSNHRGGVRSNDTTPVKKTSAVPSKTIQFNTLERDMSQPKEGNLSTMNVPKIPYDPNGDPLQLSKSPNRFKSNHFSPNMSRGRNRNAAYNNSFRSPQGRNMPNNFNTINQTQNNVHSIDMGNQMSTVKNYMVYPNGGMGDSYADMKQYAPGAPGGPQYMLSMSTNINLGLIDRENIQQQQMPRRQNNVNLNFKKNTKR